MVHLKAMSIKQTPFLIKTIEDLARVASGEDGWDDDSYYKQVADIDLAGYEGWVPLPPLVGIYDGNGYAIRNLTYASNKQSEKFALFSQVGAGGVIKDLFLDTFSIHLEAFFSEGSPLTLINDGHISNCRVWGGSINSGKDAGGLVLVNNGTITNCGASCTVQGASKAGGLVVQNNGNISQCYARGDVSRADAGGFVCINDGLIENCYAAGNVSGVFAGGFIDKNSGYLMNCYAIGAVLGSRTSGGLARYNTNTITNSFYDKDTTGQMDTGKGEPKTTEEMRDLQTFQQWNIVDVGDFDFAAPSIWFLVAEEAYPRLGWEYKPPHFTLTTIPATEITTTSAKLGGRIEFAKEETLWPDFEVEYLDRNSFKTSEVQVPINCTLYMDMIADTETFKAASLYWFINGEQVMAKYSGQDYWKAQEVSVNAGDTLSLNAGLLRPEKSQGTMRLYLDSIAGPVVAEFDFILEGLGDCYLTTAMVNYYGKDDNGPELTALRKLRTYYQHKNKDLLQEYAFVSPRIIRAIEQSANPIHYYQEIKEVVERVVFWVAAKRWAKAKEIYLDLYKGLKTEFGIKKVANVERTSQPPGAKTFTVATEEERVAVFFQYKRADKKKWLTTAPVEIKEDGDFTRTADYLVPHQVYEYRAMASSNGVNYYGRVLTLQTKAKYCQYNSEALRASTFPYDYQATSKRRVARGEQNQLPAIRLAIKRFGFKAATGRCLNEVRIIKGDVRRAVLQARLCTADTIRKTVEGYQLATDTLRRILTQIYGTTVATGNRAKIYISSNRGEKTMNELLIIGKTYFFRGEFFDAKDNPQNLDVCKFVVRDGTEQVIFEHEVQPIAKGIYEYAFPITREKGVGILLIGFEGTLGNMPETTERLKVERRW
jgi:hypothetical protein